MNKKQAKEYLKENEINVQKASAAFTIIDSVFSPYADSYKVHGCVYEPVFSYVSYRNMQTFYQLLDQRKLDVFASKMYTDFIKDPNSLKDRIKKHTQLTKEADKFWLNYKKGNNLKKAFNELVKTSTQWWYYGSIGEDKGGVIDKEVVVNFERRYGISKLEARDVVYKLSHPKEQSFINVERKFFLEICLDFLDKKDIKNKINKYLKDFFWIKDTFYKSVELTPEVLIKEIEKEIKENSKSEIEKEIQKIDETFKNIHKEEKELRNKLQLTEEDEKDIEFTRLTIYWIDVRKFGMGKLLHYWLQLFEDISEEYKIDYRELTLYRVKDVKDLLKKEKKVEKELIEKRDNGMMCVYEKDYKVRFFYGKEGKELFNIATKKDEKEIKGITASKGTADRVKGRVRIIEDPSKQNIQKGEILVTSMTRIEFVPQMRRAKAIVTDEGGLACHAAIVSRELGIPCIVGTKIATKVLKDNNLVELDLDNGEVRRVINIRN